MFQYFMNSDFWLMMIFKLSQKSLKSWTRLSWWKKKEKDINTKPREIIKRYKIILGSNLAHYLGLQTNLNWYMENNAHSKDTTKYILQF